MRVERLIEEGLGSHDDDGDDDKAPTTRIRAREESKWGNESLHLRRQDVRFRESDYSSDDNNNTNKH